MKALKLISSCFILAILFLLGSCSKESLKPESNNKRVTIVIEPCDTLVKTFYAGQHTDVGSISVTNDDVNIYVTFATKDNWLMGQTHLYVGPKEDMPTTPKGNPKIGNFPYKMGHSPMVDSYTYTIPLSNFDDECIIIAAHAEVHHIGKDGEIDQSETAWGDGDPMTKKGSWAMFFEYCICSVSDV